MIDKNKHYRTRDGREVRIYATDGVNGNRVHGAVYHQKAGWEHRAWFPDGRHGACDAHPLDLIEVRPRIQREVWVNVFPESVSWALFASKELADKYAHDDRIACVRLTIDCAEGEGL
jgi:hypothetical protein